MCGAKLHGGAQIIRREQTVDQAGREAIATAHAVIDLQSSTVLGLDEAAGRGPRYGPPVIDCGADDSAQGRVSWSV